MMLSIVVPAYNESSHIACTIRAILQAREDLNRYGIDAIEVIVVDDGSRDATSELARDAGATVISLGRNRGKGYALMRGLRAASGEIVAFLDADLGATAGEVARLVAPVVAGDADLTIARFPAASRRGGFGLVKTSARIGVRLLGKIDMVSSLSGQRVARKHVFEDLMPFAGGFGVEVGMTIDAARKGYRIKEVPVDMHHAETGRDLCGFIHRARQLSSVVRVILAKSFMW
ncbi:MAG TPA: glycosyltransferase family 2 protein [Firmicutes bacterium]|nr:glycosyltransferase family 2 protein [Bacillota bacterium]